MRTVSDALNARTYAIGEVVDTYRRLDGYTDPGERVALELVAGPCANQPILDIGVGAGRTVELLRAISAEYRAVDYTPAMVRACRARYPDVRVELGDARDLRGFEDESFGLVVFSFNGLDSLSHEDRLRALRSVRRVLAPSGVFLFSSHDRADLEARRSRFALPTFPRTTNPIKLAYRGLLYARRLATAVRAELEWRSRDEWHDDHAIVLCPAHDHGLMIYHARRECVERQLRDAGFRGPVTVVANDGRVLGPDDDASGVAWFHYIARCS